MERSRGGPIWGNFPGRSNGCSDAGRHGGRHASMGRLAVFGVSRDGTAGAQAGPAASATTWPPGSNIYCHVPDCREYQICALPSYLSYDSENHGADDGSHSSTWRASTTSGPDRFVCSTGPYQRSATAKRGKGCYQAPSFKASTSARAFREVGSQTSGDSKSCYEPISCSYRTWPERSWSYAAGTWEQCGACSWPDPHPRGRWRIQRGQSTRVSCSESLRQAFCDEVRLERDQGRLGRPCSSCDVLGYHCKTALTHLGQCQILDQLVLTITQCLRSHTFLYIHSFFECEVPSIPKFSLSPLLSWPIIATDMHRVCVVLCRGPCRCSVPVNLHTAPPQYIRTWCLTFGCQEALSSPWGIFVPDCPNTWQSMRRDCNCALFGCTVRPYTIGVLAQPPAHHVLERISVSLFSNTVQVPRCQKDASVAQGHLPGDLEVQGTGQKSRLSAIAAVLLPLMHTFALLLHIAFLRFCLKAYKLSCISRRCDKFCPPTYFFALLRPLQGISGREPALNWKPGVDRKGRLDARHSGRRKPCKGAGWRLALALLLGPCSLPSKIGHSPVYFGALAVMFFPGAHAMTRPPQPDDPPGVAAGQGRPHLIPPDQITTFVGSCEVHLPWEDPAPPREPATHISYDVPWPRPGHGPPEDGTWLGVYLYTPHYQPLTFAIRPPERSLKAVIDTIQSDVQGVPSGLFDCIVPLRPQPFQGCASFIRYPRALQHSGVDGFAAVVCDLTMVGGHYFATTLPRSLALSVLLEYLTPLTKDDDRELQIFVGFRQRPWPDCAQLVLNDGDVITASFFPDPGLGRFHIEALFHENAVWGHIWELFRPEVAEATCVLHAGKRYTFKPHYHYDLSLVQYICQRLRLRPEETVMCTYEIKDLDVQGVPCRYIVAVHDVPSPLSTGVTREQAQDLFALLDFRPLGMRPQAVCVNQPKLHIPTSDCCSLLHFALKLQGAPENAIQSALRIMLGFCSMQVELGRNLTRVPTMRPRPQTLLLLSRRMSDKTRARLTKLCGSGRQPLT